MSSSARRPIRSPSLERGTVVSLSTISRLVVLRPVVGVAELTRVAMNIASATYRPLEAYLACAALYLILNGAIALFGAALERRIMAG